MHEVFVEIEEGAENKGAGQKADEDSKEEKGKEQKKLQDKVDGSLVLGVPRETHEPLLDKANKWFSQKIDDKKDDRNGDGQGEE